MAFATHDVDLATNAARTGEVAARSGFDEDAPASETRGLGFPRRHEHIAAIAVVARADAKPNVTAFAGGGIARVEVNVTRVAVLRAAGVHLHFSTDAHGARIGSFDVHVAARGRGAVAGVQQHVPTSARSGLAAPQLNGTALVHLAAAATFATRHEDVTTFPSRRSEAAAEAGRDANVASVAPLVGSFARRHDDVTAVEQRASAHRHADVAAVPSGGVARVQDERTR